MSEATDDLITKAQQQLDEHKEWLATEIEKLSPEPGHGLALYVLCAWQARQIKLRVARCTSHKTISVVWEYPDELVAFLRAETTPKHLRDSLAGGHVVDPSQRTFTATRETEP